MRKADLIQNIAIKTKLHKVDVLVAVEEMCREIKLSLEHGHAVHIRGFGSFVINKTNVRRQRGDAAHTNFKPSFIPAAEFVDCVKKCETPVISDTENE